MEIRIIIDDTCFQDPFLAIVVDPTRTISAGKVSLGAFRTYPKGYQPSDAAPSEYQTIPLNKIEDYGVHCKQYYALDVTYFKSTLDKRLLDLLWNKYWLDTLRLELFWDSNLTEVFRLVTFPVVFYYFCFSRNINEISKCLLFSVPFLARY